MEALRRRIETQLMSLTGLVNVGTGAVTIGFADEPHTFSA